MIYFIYRAIKKENRPPCYIGKRFLYSPSYKRFSFHLMIPTQKDVIHIPTRFRQSKVNLFFLSPLFTCES